MESSRSSRERGKNGESFAQSDASQRRPAEKIFVGALLCCHQKARHSERKSSNPQCYLKGSATGSLDVARDAVKSLRQDSHHAEQHWGALGRFLPHTQGRNRLASTSLP